MDVGGRITSGTVIETTIKLCKPVVAASPHPAGVITPHGLRSLGRGINYSAYPYASPLLGLREKLFPTVFSAICSLKFNLASLTHSYALVYKKGRKAYSPRPVLYQSDFI